MSYLLWDIIGSDRRDTGRLFSLIHGMPKLASGSPTIRTLLPRPIASPKL